MKYAPCCVDGLSVHREAGGKSSKRKATAARSEPSVGSEEDRLTWNSIQR
jgi:hypothetical protein